MEGFQMALPTQYMSLDEVLADHVLPFDEVVRDLEIEEARVDVELDDEAAGPVEFLRIVRPAPSLAEELAA